METHNLADFPRKACLHNKGKPVRIAIWGDSRALAWEPFAWALAKRAGVGEMSYSRDGCQPALSYAAGPSYLAPRIPHIILLGPTPYLRGSVPQCIAAHDLAACAISAKEYYAQSQPIRERLQSLANKYPNVRYVELGKFFCNSMTCPAMKDGYGLYWDTNHPSATAARAFSRQYLAAEHQQTVASPLN